MFRSPPRCRFGSSLAARGASPEAGITALVQAIVGSARQHFRGEAASLKTAHGNLCIISNDHPVAAMLRAQGSRVELLTRAGWSMVAELAYETAPSFSVDACLLDVKLASRLDIAADSLLELRPSLAPASREVLRRKIRDEELSCGDVGQVVDDTVHGRYLRTELAGFLVSAANGLTTEEVVALAKSRARLTGNVHWDAPVVEDKHSMV